MLPIKTVADALQDHLRVGVAHGVQPEFDQLIEQLVGVGHVEVAGQDEISAGGVVRAQIGVAVGQVIAGVRPIAKVPQIHLAEEVTTSLQFVVAEVFEVLVAQRVDVIHDNVEDALDGVVLVRADAFDVLDPRGHVELDDRDARAVLSAVVLLLHQQVQPAQSPGGVAVPLPVIAQRLPQPQQSQTAVVADRITHPSARVGPATVRCNGRTRNR